MHSNDPRKSLDKFLGEVEAILGGYSRSHPHKDRFDFTKFVFIDDLSLFGKKMELRVEFWGATFMGRVDCTWTTFTQEVDFSQAIFTGFTFFGEATFMKRTDFSDAMFIKNTSFRGATFHDAVEFRDVKFEKRDQSVDLITDFRDVKFLKPEVVCFLRTNAQATSGLRARFVGCRTEGVPFDAVHWHQHDGRMVLQDELDILEAAEGKPSCEEVAIAYRRLITNFGSS